VHRLDPAQNQTTYLYQDDSVAVTPTWFVAADGRRYRVRELRQLVESEGSIHAGVLVSLVIAAGTALSVLGMALVTRSPAPVGVVALTIVVPVLTAAFCAYRWPRSCALRATYYGFDIELFRTRDARRFRRVAQAANRASEASRRVPL
jgi:hypothetical protein